MVYHEVRKRNNLLYNYIIHNVRDNHKWKKKSKFIGKGKLSKDRIDKEIKKFKTEMPKYLSKENYNKIEKIKDDFHGYLKKGGISVKENFNEWFSTELTYNSNAIEGNTLSLRETSMIINEGVVPKGSNLRDVYEAKNHKNSLEFLKNCKGDLNEKLILKINSFILRNIDDSNAGKYRKVNVYIRGEPDVKFPIPKEIPNLMKELIIFYKKNKSKYHPLELAALTSMKFVNIHPFVDGNGRVSRLIMNFIMNKFNYPEISIYFRDRQNYLRSVRKASNEDYELIIDFLIKTMEKNYKFLEEEIELSKKDIKKAEKEIKERKTVSFSEVKRKAGL